jgi:arylsulfatase A-like enzyme
MKSADAPDARARPPSACALVVVLSGAAAAGLLESTLDLLDVGGDGALARAPSVIAYGMATWVGTLLPCVLAGLVTMGLLRWVTRRGDASLGVALGVGAWSALAVTLDERGVSAALGVGVLAFGLTAFVLRRLLARRAVLRASGAALAVALAYGLVALAVTPATVVDAPAARGRAPIVLIVADALRADALGCYGGAHPTPRIDGLGEGGWVVEDVVSSSSWTLPAVASLWSGVSPRRHGISELASVLPEDVPLLAEHLAGEGYATGAVLGNPLLDPRRGYGRGFDLLRGNTHAAESSFFWIVRLNRWVAEAGWRTGAHSRRKLVLPRWSLADGWTSRRTGYLAADEVTAEALDLADALAGHDRLLYVHYFDPHDPYLPHPTGALDGQPALEPANLPRLAELYAGEVAFLDEQIGVLLDGLEQRGLLDEALIVFTSDHGEEFLDHGGWLHYETLYDELLRVPLVLRFPGGRAPGSAPREASLIDVAPTILSVLGLPPLPGVQGRDLARGGEAPPRLSERVEQDYWLAAVRRAGWQWIARFPGNVLPDPAELARWEQSLEQAASGDGVERPGWSPATELFELARDPTQQRPRADGPEGLHEGNLRLLLEYLADQRVAQRQELSDEERSRLRALGYLK